MATIAFQPPSPSRLAPRSRRHGRARPRDRWRRSADGSGPRARRAAASRRDAPRRSLPARTRARSPCLWIAIRLKLRGANGSPSTASTRALTRGGRPAHLAQHQVAGFGVLQVADRTARAARFLSTGDSQKRVAFLRTTPSTSSAERASFFIGWATKPSPFSSVRASTRSPMPSAPRRRARSIAQLRRRGLGVPLLGHRPDVAAVVDLD